MKRVAMTLLLICCLTLAGCAHSGEDRDPTLAYPDPPATLTDEAATSVAIDHERARVHNSFRNQSEVDYFDVGYMWDPNATVVNRTSEGVLVVVEVHVSFSTRGSSGTYDGWPVRSRYLVSDSAVVHRAVLTEPDVL
jgi:hypothetical protein